MYSANIIKHDFMPGIIYPPALPWRKVSVESSSNPTKFIIWYMTEKGLGSLGTNSSLGFFPLDLVNLLIFFFFFLIISRSKYYPNNYCFVFLPHSLLILTIIYVLMLLQISSHAPLSLTSWKMVFHN